VSRRTTAGAAALTALLAGGLAGCSGGDSGTPDADRTSSVPTAAAASPSPPPTPTPTAPPRAAPVAVPPGGACYTLTFRQAVSPTNGEDPVACRAPHTAETFRVDRVDNVVAGHLLAVDSRRVQRDVARTCPASLGAHVGGAVDDQRLSMLRAVWFTPSLEQAGKGAAWFRCDAVALAGAEDLLDVQGTLAGALDTAEGRDRYGMCGTASPGAPDFERVPCGAPHSWRAFSVISLEPGRYPGAGSVEETGSACEDAAAGVAADPLDYEWASEGPDAEQWAAGQTFVRCWAPD